MTAKKDAKTKASKAGNSNTNSKRTTQKSTKTPNENGQHTDIIGLILDDHKIIKELIETMKDEDADQDELRDAFDEFAPTLLAHAKPEEQTLYKRMKEMKELRSGGFEAEVEHALAEQLIEEIKSTKDKETWRAKVKVLAEIVEHHVEEEEKEFLPDFKKESEKEDREQLGEQFLALKQEFEAQGSDDAPSEAQMEKAG